MQPDASAYQKLFHWHKMDDGDFFKSSLSEQDVIDCFDQVCALARHHSAFNDSLPAPILNTLRAYVSGHPGALENMADPGMKSLLLSDLYDYIHLSQRIRS